MKNIYYVTVATQNEGSLDVQKRILSACSDFDYANNFTVLGFGQEWTGFLMKFDLLYEYFFSSECRQHRPDDIVVFADAFDVIYTRDTIAPIVDVFERANCELFICADGPFIVGRNNIDHGNVLVTEMRKYLYRRVFSTLYNDVCACSGGIIGRRWAMKEVLLFIKRNLERFRGDDQVALNVFLSSECVYDEFRDLFVSRADYCGGRKIRAKIDLDCLAFFNYYGGFGFTIAGPTADFFETLQWKLAENGFNHLPLFLHFPGEQSLAAVTKRICEANGWDVDPCCRSTSVSFKKIVHYMHFFSAEIVFLVSGTALLFFILKTQIIKKKT